MFEDAASFGHTRKKDFWKSIFSKYALRIKALKAY